MIYKPVSILVNFLTKPTLETHSFQEKKRGRGRKRELMFLVEKD